MSCTSFLLVFAVVAAAACATQVLECPNTPLDVEDKVQISACEEPPCRLRRKTVPEIRLVFRPDHDIKNLRTTVNAVIAGIPVPFIGVDGTSACGKIFSADGKKKVDCPLQKGQDYMYINSFKIHEVYPKVFKNNRPAMVHANIFFKTILSPGLQPYFASESTKDQSSYSLGSDGSQSQQSGLLL